MAFQGYRHKSDKTVGENEASPTKVAGRPDLTYRDGGENKTPAPTGAAEVLSARDSTWGRAHTGQENSGQNSFGQASSLAPGQKGDKAEVDPCAPVDAVKDALLVGGAEGAQHSDDWQTRNADFTSEQADKTAWGNRSRSNEGGVIPKKVGSAIDDSVSRRNAMLRAFKG